MCHYNTDSKYNFCGDYSGVYRSTRYDVVGFYEFPPYIPAFIIDLPFALVVDTLLLPYDLGVVINDQYEEWQEDQRKTKKLALTSKVMSQSPFSCPDGATLKIKEGFVRLGEISISRYCVTEHLKDGPYESWMAQHLDIRGGYSRGFKHGEWIWFNEDGSIWQKALYFEGNLLSMRHLTSNGWEPAPHIKKRSKTPETEE